MDTIVLVPKESIPEMHFVHEDVLKTTDQRKLRASMLDKATILGNGYHSKVKIIFETTDGTKAVETTVWQASEDQVTLKGGVNLPMHTIREILL